MSNLNDAGIERAVNVERHRAIGWDEFLTSYPPGKHALIHSVAEVRDDPLSSRSALVYLRTPLLRLECHSEQCASGIRNFACSEKHEFSEAWKTYCVEYQCRDCLADVTVFALAVKPVGELHSDYPVPPRAIRGTAKPFPKFAGEALKIGQWPPFGPSVPSRVIGLIGPDRDLFLKGRRAESQGMGVGAFSYYRRVVENQKGRLFDEIAKVAKRCSAPSDIVSKIESAKTERQFARAIESVKDAIPDVLRIDGHNPLTLLHSALSKGLHAESDETCLELASSIRIVLTELADRIGQALKEHAELDTAVSRLLQATEATKRV